jgi:hypothetical protein
MFASRPSSHTLRTLLFLALAAVLVGSLPAVPARAAVEFSVPVDDTTAEFGDAGSTYLLTSLVEQTDEPATPTNRRGGVQLAPIGTLDWKGTANNIPATRNEIAAAAIGKYIFAIGGITGATLHNSVYRGVVDQVTGDVAWTVEDQSLPAVKHSITPTYTDLSAGRSNAAVATLVTDAAAGNGFIYVIGGSVQAGNTTISSRSVLVGVVQGGDLTSWRVVGFDEPTTTTEVEGFLPRTYAPANLTSNNLPRGVDGASAFTATIGGTTYLYVVGGRQIGPNESGTQFNNAATRRVIYGTINTSTGDLTWLSNGTAGTYFDIPDTNGEAGFFNGALVYGQFAGTDGQLQSAFFYTGGQISASSPNFTSRVVKGVIGTNGTVTFSNSASSGDGSLLDTRNNHGAVLWDNAVYTLAGKPGTGSPLSPPTSNAASQVSAVTADRVLQTQQGSSSNFQQLLDPQGGGPPQRFSGGYVVVPSATPRISFVYYIGGTNGSVESAEVNRASIGEPPVTPNYAADGWYFSAPFTITLGGSQVRVKTVRWRGENVASSGGDLLVSYRTSTDANCAVPTQLVQQSWTDTLDATTGAGFSQDGNNEATLGSDPVNCFQYRVKIQRGADATKTPSLTRLVVVVERPGSADLKFFNDQIEARRSGTQLTGLDIKIANDNTFEPPTVSADYGDGGSFTVDLFVYPPGVTPNTPVPGYSNDFPSTQYNRATIQVDRALLTPGRQYIVNTNDTRWQWTRQNGTVVTGAVDLSQLFPSVGTYTMVAVVDGPTCGLASTIGCVKETAVGQPGYDYLSNNPAEANNISTQVQLVVDAVPPPTTPTGVGPINLPLVFNN